MADRDALISYMDEMLASDEWADYCPNGLQVEGSDTVDSIVTGVSANQALLDAARDVGAQMVLVHHGLFWKGGAQRVIGPAKRRLETLIKHGISLAGYHLPLDAHPVLGNNALICAGLGLTRHDEPFAVMEGKAVGCVGESDGNLAFSELLSRVEEFTGRKPLHLGHSPASVRRVAICSGGAQRELESAAALGVDVFITGEAGEPTHQLAQELGIAFISAGHYATEICGIRALGEHVAEQFSLKHTFIDIPTLV